jgi:anti-sigma regulatory factor (Ser/Thr protein kinase)
MKKARRFHCHPESVAGARRFVGGVLSEQPCEIVEVAELMTSELATNCLRHARSDFELTIHLSREEVRVELSDHGEGQPVLRSPAPSERSGRGLRIVQELSEDWGVAASPGGKIVWFTLPLRRHEAESKQRSGASRENEPAQSHGLGRSQEADVGSSRPRMAELRPFRWSARPCRHSRSVCRHAQMRIRRRCVYRVAAVGISTLTQGSVEADRGFVNRGQVAACREILGQRVCRASSLVAARSVILRARRTPHLTGAG